MKIFTLALKNLIKSMPISKQCLWITLYILIAFFSLSYKAEARGKSNYSEAWEKTEAITAEQPGSNETVLTTNTFRPFITIWKTNNEGTSEDNQITIPTTGDGYDYDIYWEKVDDASINGSETGVTGSHTITFPSAGTFRVEISGQFPRIYFNGSGDMQKILDIEQWGDMAWSSMESAFWGCNNLTMSAMDTPYLSNVTDMAQMFYFASSIDGDLSQWDVSSVSDMRFMFRGASSFNGNISQWDVSNVTYMYGMFFDASNFNGDLSQWDVSSVTDMSVMFWGASSFNGNISHWDVSNVTNMGEMFKEASNFNGDISRWDVSSVTYMGGIFRDASSFNGNISQWDVSSVTDMRFMFAGASSFNGNISQWDVSNVTNMSRMFRDASSFNGDISQWDVSSVSDMSWMFSGASNFNGDISRWDVSSVTHMSGMFWGASSFNGDLSQWDVSNVTDMSVMFINTDSFNGDISQWNVSSVTNIYSMFANASSFNGDLSQWDVSNVTNMFGMFESASSFNSDLSLWDVSSVTNMSFMFSGASNFVGDLNQWDVGSVTNMSEMFMDASSFNGDLSHWDVSNVIFMGGMLSGSGLSNGNYDKLLDGWLSNGVAENVTLGADGLIYCKGAVARQALIDNHGWTISDYGQDCSQTITFLPLEAKTEGDADFELTAMASSGLPITYTSSNESVATVSGNIVTIKRWGLTTITASQPGDGDYEAADPVSQKLTVYSVTGIGNNEHSGIKIYPNPTNDHINLEVDGIAIRHISLFDVHGKKLFEHNGVLEKIDISQFTKGLYFLHINFSGTTSFHKVIKR